MYKEILEEVITALSRFDQSFKFEETRREIGENRVEVIMYFHYGKDKFVMRHMTDNTDEGFNLVYASTVKQLCCYGVSKGIEVSKQLKAVDQP